MYPVLSRGDYCYLLSSALSGDGSSPWIEVTFGLVGDLGEMRALMPSMILRNELDQLSLEERFLEGRIPSLTPPPSEIVKPEVIEAARQRMESVADRFGLRGIASIDAFMHVETGEIIVMNIDPVPNFTEHSVLVQQVRRYPTLRNVFHHVQISVFESVPS